MSAPTDDVVNSPSHYKGKTWECIEIIRALNLDYWRGNALKYIVRHPKKGGSQDIAKAIYYLHDAIRTPIVAAALSYHVVNDHDVAQQMTGSAIAENFGIENLAIIEALEALHDSVMFCIGRDAVEEALSTAAAHLRAYLTAKEAGEVS